MPKIQIRHDEPIWDELVATLGDPRPYETSITATSYVPSDEPWFEPTDFEFHERHTGELSSSDDATDADDVATEEN